MNDLITVIVPCYNQANFLPAALDSVLNQTYANWECIIVNDGSPDNSGEIALKYCEADSRFKYHVKVNGGLSSARNAALDLVSGEWVQFLDSDDYLESDKLMKSMQAINARADISIVISDFRMFTEQPADATAAFCRLTQDLFNFESILFGWDVQFNIPIHSGLFRAERFKNIRFNEQLKSNEDWVMWLHFFKDDPAVVFVEETYAYYRINPQSMTKDALFVRDHRLVAYKHIIDFLPDRYKRDFTFAVLDRLNNLATQHENDIKILKRKLRYRLTQKAISATRKFFKGPAK